MSVVPKYYLVSTDHAAILQASPTYAGRITVAKYNPFRPGKAVTPELFAGRTHQLDQINGVLSQTRQGNSEHLAVFGERGIGKSSLLDAAASAASGSAVENLEAFDFVVVQIQLSDKDSEAVIVRKILARLKDELAKRRRVQELLQSTWGLLQRIEVAGTGLRQKDPVGESLIDPAGDLARVLAEAALRLEGKADGVLLLVDEADAAGAALGRVAKQLVDVLSDERCDRVCMIVAGMPTIVPRLREGHESAPRIFEPLPVEPMSGAESEEIVRKGLAEIEVKTGSVVTIDDAALHSIANFSSGYPQFVQQIASSAIEFDTDDHITRDDVMDGMLRPGGAIEKLGTKHFQVAYFDLTKSDEYRAVLLAMARQFMDGKEYMLKDEIRAATKLKETTLTNALHMLKERGMIQAHPAKRGEYRLPSLAFALYVQMVARGREYLQELAIPG